MKIITEYFEFVKSRNIKISQHEQNQNNYKLTEGYFGQKPIIEFGASFDLNFLYTKNGVKEINKKYKLHDGLTINTQLEDEPSVDLTKNIKSSDMFSISLEYNSVIEYLENIKLGDIRIDSDTDFMLEYSDETTLSELTKKGINIPFRIKGSGDNLHEYIGNRKGYGVKHDNLIKDDTIISSYLLDLENVDIYIFNIHCKTLMYNFLYDSLSVNLELKPKELFKNIWNNLLNDEYGIRI